MTKMMKKVANGVKTMASRATGLVRDKKGRSLWSFRICCHSLAYAENSGNV